MNKTFHHSQKMLFIFCDFSILYFTIFVNNFFELFLRIFYDIIMLLSYVLKEIVFVFILHKDKQNFYEGV